MRATKIQDPTSGEIPTTKHQTRIVGHHSRLKLGISLAPGWCAFVLLLAQSVAAQTYSIHWHTIDGGGGTSTGGVYSVSGTMGQPDAGPTMTNGQYTVTGGFWALPIAVQTEGAPTLTIALATPGNVNISWAPHDTNYVLQETTILSPSNWTNSPSGSANPVVIPATSLPRKFYRLFKP